MPLEFGRGQEKQHPIGLHDAVASNALSDEPLSAVAASTSAACEAGAPASATTANSEGPFRLAFLADRPAYSKLKDAAVALDGLLVRHSAILLRHPGSCLLLLELVLHRRATRMTFQSRHWRDCPASLRCRNPMRWDLIFHESGCNVMHIQPTCTHYCTFTFHASLAVLQAAIEEIDYARDAPSGWKGALAEGLSQALVSIVQALGRLEMQRVAKTVCRERERDIFSLAKPAPAVIVRTPFSGGGSQAACPSDAALTWPARDGGGPVARKFDNYKYRRYGMLHREGDCVELPSISCTHSLSLLCSTACLVSGNDTPQ